MSNRFSVRARAVILAGGLATAFGVSGCGKGPAASKAPPAHTDLLVSVVQAEQVKLDRRLDATGAVSAWQDVPVAAETGGYAVSEILVDEGALVKKGQPLLKLNDALLRAAYAQAEAGVVSAKASAYQASRALTRSQDLYAKGFVSLSALENADAAQKTAAAAVGQADAGLGQAKARLDQAVIRAPSAGRISLRQAVLGQVVSVGQTLFRLTRDDVLEVEAQVPESEIARIKAGQTVKVVGDHGAGSANGRVRIVPPQVDASTRLGVARITLEPGSTLKPGMYARATIDLGPVDTLVAPQSAIVYRDGKPTVFLAGADGRAHGRIVALGERQDDKVEVLSGLAAGDRIVDQGAGFLVEGEAIKVGTPAVARSGQ